MIVRLWNRFTKARDRFWLRILVICRTPQYKKLLAVVLIVFIASGIGLLNASTAPRIVGVISKWTILICAAFILPTVMDYSIRLRIRNRMLYDPASAEVRKMARNWRMISWSILVFGLLYLIGVAILLASEDIPMLLIWSVAPAFLFFMIGFLGLQRAADMNSGDWSPPAWMPPMNEANKKSKLDLDEE